MKNKNNFWLLLKQGIKGVFKFKIQFIIILILSFLSTFILTISISVSRRIEDSYNKIVKTVKPFNYESSTTIGKKVTVDKNSYLVPLTDFLNNEYSYSNISHNRNQFDKDLSTNESSYNFVFNNLYLKENEETFLTRTIDNESFQQAFLTYQNEHDKNFVTMRNVLVSEIITSIENIGNNQYLNTSTVGIILKNNPSFFNFLNNYYVNESDGENDVNKFTKDQINFINYLFDTAETFINWIDRQWNLFYDEVNKNSLNSDENNRRFFEFLFGKTTIDKQPIEQKYIVDKESRYITNLDLTNLESINENKNNRQNFDESKIIENGLRGITTPIIFDENNNDASFFDVNYVEFTHFSSNDKYREIRNNLSIYKNYAALSDNRFNDLNKYKLNANDWGNGNEKGVFWLGFSYQEHIRLTALASGFSTKFRKEIFAFDNVNAIQYRMIVLNSDDETNLTIFQGSKPSSLGEVIINQQFAKAHGLKIGDNIKVSNGILTISGIGTDTYSYFPASDPNFPVPQPKTSAIIYGSWKTIELTFSGINGGNNDDTQTQNFNFFLTANENYNNYSSTMFSALQMNTVTSLYDNYQFIQEAIKGPDKIKIYDQIVKSNISSDDPNVKETLDDLAAKVSSSIPLKAFDSSNYRFNWTLEPRVITTYNVIAYIASAVIAIIALVSLVICIRKTIYFNSKQIGILKALGASPSNIANSYLAYSIIITLTVVPLAWIIGTFVQIPFAHMFTNYLSASNNVIYFDLISLGLGIVLFGLIAGLVSFISAILVTSQSVMDILRVSVKWSNSKLVDKMKAKMFANSKFSVRFSLTLASSGKKPIFLLVAVVTITSFLISTALAIPAISINAVNSYYKSVNYANEYKNNAPTYNAPLSKMALNYWNGHDQLEKGWVEDANIDLDGRNIGYGYYKDPMAYSSTTASVSPVSRYIYTTDGNQSNLDFSLKYILDNIGGEIFLPKAEQMFSNNFFTVLGQTFSIGMIDQFFGLILNMSNDDFNNMVEYSNNNYPNNKITFPNGASEYEKRLIFSQAFSSSLTGAIPKLIAAIMNTEVSGETNNWKENIINVILTQVPPYVRGYIEKSGSRYEQFGIGYATEQYIPKEETLITKLDASSSKYSSLKITGIDKSQEAFAINDQQKAEMYYNQQTLNDLEIIFTVNKDGELKSSVQQAEIRLKAKNIYNPDTQTLTLPVLTNKQSEAYYKLKKNDVLQGVSTVGKSLQFWNGASWSDLPRNAWIYDDSDYLNSNFVNKNPLLKDSNNQEDVVKQEEYMKAAANVTGHLKIRHPSDSNWLDVYSLDNSKFTYNEQYELGSDSKTTLNDQSYLFDDFTFNSEGQVDKSISRPYYEYKNIKLFIPLPSDENEQEKYIDLLTNSMFDENKSDNLENHPWFKTVLNSDVPKTVLEAYGIRDSNTKFLEINPYDLSYNANPTQGLARLMGDKNNKYWFRYALESQIQPPLRLTNGMNKYANTNLKINLKSVGTLSSYNDRLLLMDTTLANLLNNYSTSVGYQANTNYFANLNGSYSNDNNKLSFDTYNVKNPVDSVFVEQGKNQLFMGSETVKYAPKLWHNGKLSNISEPIGLTSGISYVATGNVGQFAIGLGNSTAGSVEPMIEDQTLLSTSKDLINQVSMLAISIGMLLIVAIIITASLLIMLVGDIYIMQYQRFMILMRALGYQNHQIQMFAFGTVTIFSIIFWVLATVLSWGIISIGIYAISKAGFAIPYGLSWWPPIASLAIISISYFGSLIVSSNKIRSESPSVLMSQTNE